ncbi:MAG: response regulator [Alphaproteobacteria bacterium]|nr:response regulator [Alphaproteobacteria bacterium]
MHKDTPKNILIVEDEVAIADVVKEYLAEAQMEAVLLSSGVDAATTILSGAFDLVILDLMLPGIDGLTICQEVRKTSEIPIIMVTAKVEEIDRLVGLETGADDYLCKPFSPRELVARVKAVLRRTSNQMVLSNESSQRLVVDPERWIVTFNGVNISLTRREFILFEILHSKPGRVYSRAQLLELAYDHDSDVIDRAIDSHIKNIRIKFEAVCEWDPIRSVYGIGYSYDG